MSARDSQAGFSVLELTIVIMVIFVLAAIAIPNMISAARSYKVNIAAQALEQQLNRCRQEAVRKNQPVPIKITAATTSSAIDLDDGGTDFTDDGTDVTLSNDATITINSPTDGIVTFTSRGEMLIGVNPSFTFSYSGASRTVTIDPRGAVSIGAEVDS
jgi:Tfp pilus assembly protein FimT